MRKKQRGERAALRALDGLDTPASAPPSVAVKKLRMMGYTVEEWKHCDGWWVGYASRKPAICTICEVTGKAIIEVCTRHDYAEVLLPSGERI